MISFWLSALQEWAPGEEPEKVESIDKKNNYKKKNLQLLKRDSSYKYAEDFHEIITFYGVAVGNIVDRLNFQRFNSLINFILRCFEVNFIWYLIIERHCYALWAIVCIFYEQIENKVASIMITWVCQSCKTKSTALRCCAFIFSCR